MRENRVKIIAGQWKRRFIDFPDELGLRPTGNRIRETLFNWLNNHISEAHCLDLFAGSGALGFEAASRGAARVLMVEQSSKVIQALLESKEKLKADTVEILHLQALKQSLPKQPQPFDIVFVDPPFQMHCVLESLQYLVTNGLLAPEARVFLELERAEQVEFPEYFDILKDELAGNVRFVLLCYAFEGNNTYGLLKNNV